jgi:hypothetical protein
MTALLVSAALNAILCALSMAAILHSYPFVLNELGFPPLTAERAQGIEPSEVSALSTASSTPAREPRSDSLCMSCC